MLSVTEVFVCESCSTVDSYYYYYDYFQVKSDYLEDESKAAEGMDFDTAIQFACIEIKRVFKVKLRKNNTI